MSVLRCHSQSHIGVFISFLLVGRISVCPLGGVITWHRAEPCTRLWHRAEPCINIYTALAPCDKMPGVSQRNSRVINTTIIIVVSYAAKGSIFSCQYFFVWPHPPPPPPPRPHHPIYTPIWPVGKKNRCALRRANVRVPEPATSVIISDRRHTYAKRFSDHDTGAMRATVSVPPTAYASP